MTIFYEDEVRECLNDVTDCKEKEYALYLLEWAVNKRSFDLEAHDKKVRAEVINDFVKAIEKHQTRQDSYLDPPYVEMGLDMTDVLEVAKQLKEKEEWKQKA